MTNPYRQEARALQKDTGVNYTTALRAVTALREGYREYLDACKVADVPQLSYEEWCASDDLD